MRAIDLNQPEPEDATEAEHRARWIMAIRREQYHWSTGETCSYCGEWVGHFGGRVECDPCPLIPLNVPLEEVRPNRMTVRRNWIGDAIRAATGGR